MPQGWPYIHPVQDVQAAREAIRSGFTSRSAVVAEQGEDAEVVDAQQAADNERADELGLEYDSDGRQAEPAKGSVAEGEIAGTSGDDPNADDPNADPNADDPNADPNKPADKKADKKKESQ